MVASLVSQALPSARLQETPPFTVSLVVAHCFPPRPTAQSRGLYYCFLSLFFCVKKIFNTVRCHSFPLIHADGGQYFSATKAIPSAETASKVNVNV